MSAAWFREKKVGVALAGGAARGFAHLGVIEVLREQGVRPWCVTGTSAGSIFGALLAAEVPAESIRRALDSIRWATLARPVLPGQSGLLSLEPLERVLEQLLGNARSFAELPTRFACVAMDVERDEAVHLQSGRVSRAVRASCSIPGVFTPVEIDGRLLVDGGVVCNLPVQAAFDLGADYVIAVDLLPGRAAPARPTSILEVMAVTFQSLARATSQEARLADRVITPDLRGFSFVDFERREELVRRGRVAAAAQGEALRRDLQRPWSLASLKRWLRQGWFALLDRLGGLRRPRLDAPGSRFLR